MQYKTFETFLYYLFIHILYIGCLTTVQFIEKFRFIGILGFFEDMTKDYWKENFNGRVIRI